MAISALSGTITACSVDAGSQAGTSSPSPAMTGDMKSMDQSTMGGMDHSTMGGMSQGMSMDLGPADANYDLRFIDGMIPHHRGAIDMANEALQKSKRSEIKALAQNIIQTQNREENDLIKKWRLAWYPSAAKTPMAYDDSQQGKMVPMSTSQKDSMMMKMDLGAADNQFDLRFLDAMIPHHEGAVVMAKDALTKAKHPELKQLAKEIVASQQGEIDQMKGWRKAWYGK